MNLKERILGILKSPAFPIPLKEDTELVKTGEESFYLRSGNQEYALKWLPKGRLYSENELDVNKNVLLKTNAPAPKMEFVLEQQEGYLAGWKWLAGFPVNEGQRDKIPLAFSTLGRFHKEQKNSQPVYSLYLNQEFQTIGEMIEAELEKHCHFLEEGPKIKEKAREKLRVLTQGYPTRVHGDAHLGNMIYAPPKIKMIDWANSHNGLGLMDLCHVYSLPLKTDDEEVSHAVRPEEAASVLSAYHQSADLNHLNPDETNRAVMLLHELRMHSYGTEDNQETWKKDAKENIQIILDN